MRRIFVISLFLGLCVSSGFAFQSGMLPLGVGAKYAAMGGAASAIVDDITSAYYNPAGIVKAGSFELKLGAGAATEGMNDIIAVIGNASDPAKLLSDNFNKTVNVNGGFNGIVGINIAKVGLSVIPVTSLAFSKPTAGTLLGTNLFASAAYEGIVTFGYTFSIPGLPIAGLDLGANIKSANMVLANSTITGETNSVDAVINYSGVGFDLGAKANVNLPLVPFSVGIVVKDLSETLKGKIKGTSTTYNPAGGSTSTSLGELDAQDFTSPTTTVIGASAMIPVIGLRVAVDLDNVPGYTLLGTSQPGYSLTHIGLEYPILGIIALRAGTVSGGPAGGEISQTTFGAGFNLGAVVNVAMMTDNKNSKNNSTMVDCGFAF